MLSGVVWILSSGAFPLAGYLFRNAQYRLDLQRSIDEADGGSLPALPEAASAPADILAGRDGFAEGSQLKDIQVLQPSTHLVSTPLVTPCCMLSMTHTPPSLQGKVLRYHEDEGTLEMTAAEYISMLELENTALRKEVGSPVAHTA